MNNSLFHHGIKGQKWGVRRFQNEDGTLTPAGRSRYGTKGQKQLAKKISKYAKKGKEKQATKLISKAINETGQAQIKDDIKNYSKLSDKWNDLDEKLDEAWEDASIRLSNKVDAQMKKDGVDPNDKHRGYWEEEFIMKDPKYQKINNEWEKAYQNMKAAEKDICDTLLGEYGKKPIKDKEHYRKDVSAYVSGLLLRMKNTYNSL